VCLIAKQLTITRRLSLQTGLATTSVGKRSVAEAGHSRLGGSSLVHCASRYEPLTKGGKKCLVYLAEKQRGKLIS
jgi:hypothetical protein